MDDYGADQRWAEYHIAQEARTSGDWNTAATIFEKQALEEPEVAIRQQLAGEAKLHLHDYAAAIRFLSSAVGLAPKNVQAIYLLAQALAELGDQMRAVEMLERVLELDPQHKKAIDMKKYLDDLEKSRVDIKSF